MLLYWTWLRTNPVFPSIPNLVSKSELSLIRSPHVRFQLDFCAVLNFCPRKIWVRIYLPCFYHNRSFVFPSILVFRKFFPVKVNFSWKSLKLFIMFPSSGPQFGFAFILSAFKMLPLHSCLKSNFQLSLQFRYARLTHVDCNAEINCLRSKSPNPPFFVLV